PLGAGFPGGRNPASACRLSPALPGGAVAVRGGCAPRRGGALRRGCAGRRRGAPPRGGAVPARCVPPPPLSAGSSAGGPVAGAIRPGRVAHGGNVTRLGTVTRALSRDSRVSGIHDLSPHPYLAGARRRLAARQSLSGRPLSDRAATAKPGVATLSLGTNATI